MSRIVLILIMIFLLIPSVNAVYVDSVSEDYKDEFNSGNETCDIVDHFSYEIYSTEFIDSYRPTRAVIYECSGGNEGTINIIFDTDNREFYSETRFKEILDLNFVRYSLENGDISHYYVNSNTACPVVPEPAKKSNTVEFSSDVNFNISNTAHSDLG